MYKVRELISGMLYGEHVNLRRISSHQARKEFHKGTEIYYLANKVRPFNMWISFGYVNNSNDDDFDKFINEAVYYNCNHTFGYYLKYYIIEK